MRALATALAALTLAGCATSAAFRAGEKAERSQDYDRAVLEYSRALTRNPDNVHYRRSLQRARLRAAALHTARGRRLATRGSYQEAAEELRLALDLNPAAPEIAEALREVEERLRSGVPAVSLNELKERSREQALPGLDLTTEDEQPLAVSFRGASLKETYQALGRAAGVNFVFDPQLQDRRVDLELHDASFGQALTALGATGETLHRVLAPRLLLVAPDTPAKRREHEQRVVKTLFLSNADLKETIDLLRVVLGARRVAPVPGANALTINDSPEKVAAAERIVHAVDKVRAEVVVDVQILEVNRTLLKDYGIELTSGLPVADGVSGALFPDPTATNTLDENPYRRSNIVVTALPGVIYRLLHADDSTRVLAKPQLRATDGKTAQARFGDQVPVPVTVFTPIAQGGLSQQPITSFEYKDVGVNIDITPRVHHDGDVTLDLKLDVSALGPTGFQGLPTFNSRQVSGSIRLHDGETSILAGLIRDTERRALSGLPGLAVVPFLGRLFSRNQLDTQETDIVMTLTPHVVRRADVDEEDLRSFVLGAGESSPLVFEAPSIPALTPTPSPVPGPVAPIRPPAATPPEP